MQTTLDPATVKTRLDDNDPTTVRQDVSHPGARAPS